MESGIQAVILHNLNRIQNSEWEKATVTNKAGSPDIKGHIEGHYISIEVKDEGNRPTRLQAYRIEQTRKKGGTSFWTSAWTDTYYKLSEASKEKGFNFVFVSGPEDQGKRLFI